MRRILGAAIVCAGVVAAIALGISCYATPEPDCGFVCGSGGACPDDYACASDSICHRLGSPPSTVCTGDGGLADAALVSPTVTATSPTDGATGVSRTAMISATFSQPIVDSTVNAGSFIVEDANGVPQAGTFVPDDSTMTMSFMPTMLTSGSVITVMITGNITSTQGAPVTPLTFSFTTIDNEPPTLVSSNPFDGATAVPDASLITITFSEPVTGVDINSFAPSTTIGPIAGAISGSGATYQFTGTAGLPAASVVTVNLSSAIQDLSGNALLPVSFSFTTL
jgi:Bacterial Ig-like domain